MDLSDHSPIVCVRNTKLIKTKPRLVTKRSLKNLDNEGFLRDLYYSDLSSVFNISDVELAVETFKSIFNSVADKYAPMKTYITKDRINPWFTIELSELLQLRNKAWSKARQTRLCSDWLTFRQLRNKCTVSVKKAKSSYYLNTISSSQGDRLNFGKP